jgi:tRNA(fMet)-specific endonuclease VapC
MFLIDTNILSYLLKENKNVEEMFYKNSDMISLSVISEAECFFGAYKINSQSLKRNYNLIFETFPVISFDSKTARLFAELKSELNNLGNIIEDFDIMIAAQALAHNLTLVTNNTKHFSRIPNLKLEDWSSQ